MNVADHLIYAALWLSFALLHSLTARSGVKNSLQPLLGGWYRLAYNGFAIVHFLAISAIGKAWLAQGVVPFQWGSVVTTTLLIVQFTGIAIFIYALMQYDLGLFSGVRQARFGLVESAENEPLSLDGIHRYVRHPLYTGAHLYLWGSVRDEFTLVSAFWMSLYLIIGSRFEERALERQYGKAYSDYLARVPALIPWRGRVEI